MGRHAEPVQPTSYGQATCTTIGHEILPPGHQLPQPATKMHPLTNALAPHSHSTQMQCCELATWPKKLAIASATSYKHQGPNHENIWNLQMNRLNDGRHLIKGSLVAKVPSYGDSKSSREISEPRDQSSTNQSITSKVISHWFPFGKLFSPSMLKVLFPLRFALPPCSCQLHIQPCTLPPKCRNSCCCRSCFDPPLYQQHGLKIGQYRNSQ